MLKILRPHFILAAIILITGLALLCSMHVAPVHAFDLTALTAFDHGALIGLAGAGLIKPTVGRKVWYRPAAEDARGPVPMQCAMDQPLDATIIAVWGDRLVNVLVVDIYGTLFPKRSVMLLQDGDVPPKDINGNVTGRYVEWMPFQQGQAKAHAAMPAIETKTYADGATATGPGPLPDESPIADTTKSLADQAA